MKNPMKPMMLTAAAAGVAIALSVATSAFADDDCYVPMAKWQPREAARSWAESQGWDVRRLKVDDGCYEIEGYDESGREIEVKIDPATFAIVEFEYEDDDYEYRRKRRIPSPAGSITPTDPPDNGLFAPGSKPEAIVK